MSASSVPPAPRRGFVAAATATGAVGVASLPAALAYSNHLWPYLLALAGPIAVALAGEALGLAWVRAAGAAAFVIGVAGPLLGFGLTLAALIVVGPLGVVTAVGAAIRAVDPFAGTPFLTAVAIAIAGGFAGGVVSPPIVIGATVLVLVGGTVSTLTRLGDDDDLAGGTEDPADPHGD